MGNPRPHRQPSIEELGGIWVWLDLLTTRVKHNGLGSGDLKQRLKFRVPLTEIAKDFNVNDSDTIRNWLKRGGYVKDKDSGYWVPKNKGE